MAVETNARIEFSVASVEEWEKVNPKLHQGEPVFAKKPSGKYILKVGAPGGSTYKNAVVVWDQDDAETKMTSTQEAAAQALAFKNAASTSANAAKASETAAAASKSAAATSEANAKTSETNAAASKTAAANSASTASTKATAAGNSASAAETSATNAAKSASAAATSETNALSSASAASTSAGNANTSASNAKTSETNAANSAKAAKQSEQNAKTWDPTNYIKSIKLSKPDNNANNVCIILEEIPGYFEYNTHRAGGSFSIYPYVRVGYGSQMEFPPAHCSIIMPYNIATNAGYEAWCTNDNFVPVIIQNNETNKVYWGLSMRGHGYSALMFGAFEHNINVITTLLSSSRTDRYDGWTILQTAEIKVPATTNDVDTKLQKVWEEPGKWDIEQSPGNIMTSLFSMAVATDGETLKKVSYDQVASLIKSDIQRYIPKKTSQLTNDSGFATISNGHLVINGSELWIE